MFRPLFSPLSSPLVALKVLTLVVLGLALLSAPAWAKVTLKPTAIVDGPVVRAGDIFEGTGVDPDLDLFRAPAPGQSMILNRRQLQNLANYANLQWSARIAPDQYRVVRASTLISAASIEEEIIFALEHHGAAGPLSLIFNGQLKDIHIAPHHSEIVAVDDVSYNPNNGVFSATIRAALESSYPKSWKVSGRAFTAMEVPVLSRLIRPGEIISIEDLKWTTVRLDRIPNGSVIDAQELIGMTLKRPARPGVVLQERLLQPPLLVRRGETVTLEYTVGALRLATTAVAMTHGAKNQTIQFRNPTSGRTVDAIMVAPGLAKTTTQAMQLAAR